jgi:uncharacterized protein YkwD
LRYRGVLTTALLLAALMLCAPAQARACRGASLQPAEATAARAARATICLVNRTRHSHGLPAVRSNAKLRRAAKAHSEDMIARGYFAHDSPDGASVMDRVKATGYFDGATVWKVGETIAGGTGSLATPRAVVRAWLHSPGHREILLDGDFAEIGLGVGGDAASSAMYTADFGRR